MSIAGTKIGLSLKDVDQSTGADLSYVFFRRSMTVLTVRPHLYVQSDEERAAEERRSFAAAATGSNSTPLIHVEEQRKGTTAKRMSSPERFEIKQLIASGAVSAADVSSLLSDEHTLIVSTPT